jgi:tyrosyl-tRNA synthetase
MALPSRIVSINCEGVEVVLTHDVTAEASRSIKGGGFYVNNNKLTDASRTLQDSDLLDGRLVVLAIGKGERKILYLT